MKLLKTVSSKIIVLLFIGTFFSITVSAQKFKKEDSKSEISEYLEYMNELRKSQSATKGKSFSTEPLPMPKGVNPFISQGLEKGNVWSWRAYLQAKGQRIAESKQNKKKLSVYKEKEAVGTQSNNNASGAESIPQLQKMVDGKSNVLLEGDLAGGIDLIESTDITLEEDNSFIDQATRLEFTDDINSFFVADSPLASFEKDGSVTGDIDLYEVDLQEGEMLFYGVAPADANTVLRVLIFDSAGNILDETLPQFDNGFQRFIFTAPDNDSYYLMILELEILSRLGFIIPDISSPNTIYPEGVGGSYTAAFGKVTTDTEVDMYQVSLKKGDVFGVALFEELLLDIEFLKPDGSLAISTTAYGIFPNEETPLPVDGNVGFHYVAPEEGLYTLKVEGLGSYEGEIAMARPGLENSFPQLIYLDFTGTTLTLRDFFKLSEEELPVGVDPFFDQERSISPLKDFLENWGIENTRENNVMLAQMITDVVKENLEEDLRETNINPNFDVEIISDFGIERFGEQITRFLEISGIPHSKVIVGGSIAEFGIETIGIANAIDVGNFEANNDAITLLDVLSASEDIDGASTVFPTINNIPVDEAVSSKMELVAESVGNITAHEAGHFLGNWHANGGNGVFTIMDEGGFGIFTSVGLRNGGTFGTDQIDVDFTKDAYSDLEDFRGLDETDINTAFALSTGAANKVNTSTENLISSIETQISEEIYNLLPSTFYSYPSPANVKEKSTLVLASKSAGTALVSLYDVQGRKIAEVFNDKLSAGEIKQIDVDYGQLNLKTGFYFYKMISESGEKVHQIVVK